MHNKMGILLGNYTQVLEIEFSIVLKKPVLQSGWNGLMAINVN